MSGRGSVLSRLRLVVAMATLALALLITVPLVLGYGLAGAEAIWLAVPLVVGLANVVLVPAIGSTVRPLPPTTPDEHARRISPGVLRTLTLLRLALAESPALFGLAASVLA